MSNPMSSYSGSQDATEFLDHYKREVTKKDPRLEFHQDVVKDFGESYERAYQLWNTFYAEAYRDLSFYLGNQWSLEELAYLNNQRRSAFTYNKIRRLVNLIQGYQRKNRLSTIVSPIEDASQDTADLQTDTVQYIMQSSNGYEAISDAFKGALITGLSFLSPWVDYRSDPISGDIRFHLDEWNAVIMDPFWTKRDLSDCSFISRRKFLSRTEVISLHPNKEDVVMGLPWGSRDDKFTYMPFARQWGMQKLLNYTEYWRHKWVMRDVLVDLQTGETRPWNGDSKRLKIYRQAFPQVEVIRKPVKTVELGVICEGELIYYGKDPFGLDDYPFVPFTCIFEPSYDLFQWKIQGIPRIVRDSQSEINKRRSKMLDVLDSQLNSGWIAKTNSVSNPTSLYKSGQGQVVFLKPEAQMSDVVRLQAPDIPSGMFQLEAEFEKDMFEIIGLSPENVGMAENDKIESAGILSKMRQAAGWIPVQDIFDGLRESQRVLGEKTLKLVQLNYTPEKIRLITKKEPTPEFFSKQFSRYSVAMQEGVLTDTQQQSNFTTRVALRSMGVQITDEEIIQSSNLHDKNKITDRIRMQAEQQEQIAQQQTQMQMQQQKVLTDSLESKAQSDRALATERLAKIQLDQAVNVERISRAEEEKSARILNFVKALKEIQGMDLEQISRGLETVLKLQETSRATPEAVPSIK